MAFRGEYGMCKKERERERRAGGLDKHTIRCLSCSRHIATARDCSQLLEMAFSRPRKPVELILAASICVNLLLTAVFGTTVMDAKLRLAMASSSGNLSVLIFQTPKKGVFCETPLIIPPSGYEPPVRTVIATPRETGTYPVILFKHGFDIPNCFYTQLFEYLASSGYIVVAPQADVALSFDCTEEIDKTAEVANWIAHSLAVVLNKAVPNVDVTPNVLKLVMAGHSRGGKVAFAMALGKATEEVPRFAALVALDPVDSIGLHESIPEMVKAGCNHTDNALSIPVLILGTEYGSEFGLSFPCAPSCCSHEGYFNCSSSPLMYHLSALEYGHLDFLDDSAPYIWTHICKSGSSRAPLRNFTGRLMVAFLQATLEGNKEDMDYILENWEEIDSVKLDEPQVYPDDSLRNRPQSGAAL